MAWIPLLVIVLLLVSIIAAFEAGLIYGVNRAVENMSADIPEVTDQEIVEFCANCDDDDGELKN